MPHRAEAQEVTSMWYIGIDVHKKLCYACIKDRDGKVLGEQSFPNKSHGISILLETINGKKAKAVIESTGNLWLRLYTALEEAGIDVIHAMSRPKGYVTLEALSGIG
jgi:transposase